MKKEFRNMFLGLSLGYLLVGLAMVIWPNTSQRVICYVLGAVLVLYGLIRILMNLRAESFHSLELGYLPGVLALPIGLLLLLKTDTMLAVYGAVAGIVIIADSLVKLQFALNMKHVGFSGWTRSLIAACIFLVLGIFLLFDPFSGTTAITVCIGIFLILDAIANVYVLYEVSHTLNDPYGGF